MQNTRRSSSRFDLQAFYRNHNQALGLISRVQTRNPRHQPKKVIRTIKYSEINLIRQLFRYDLEPAELNRFCHTEKILKYFTRRMRVLFRRANFVIRSDHWPDLFGFPLSPLRHRGPEMPAFLFCRVC